MDRFQKGRKKKSIEMGAMYDPYVSPKKGKQEGEFVALLFLDFFPRMGHNLMSA